MGRSGGIGKAAEGKLGRVIRGWEGGERKEEKKGRGGGDGYRESIIHIILYGGFD